MFFTFFRSALKEGSCYTEPKYRANLLLINSSCSSHFLFYFSPPSSLGLVRSALQLLSVI